VTSLEQHDSDLEIREFAPAPNSGPEFVQEFTKHQRRLYLYILAQVGRPTDAEEILQETNLVVWRKADRFTPGTSFFAWSSRIATFEVMKHRERRGREKLRFSPEFIDAIAQDAAEASEHWEERRKALSVCLGKLRPRDRELVERRYAPGENGKSVAEDLGRPINAVYQSLGRIRRTLMECVNRQLATLASQ
jgi:RNA polymerase sigma-70 factor (ECF subfamily)